MEQKNMLSIIVTVYNMETYIHQCINSILNQTYSNYEIVIIDDGSTDNSPGICDGFAKVNPKVKVIHQKNVGLVCARKRGIKEASGEFIGFVDGDDWIEPVMYAEMMRVLIESGTDFIDTGYFEEDGTVSHKRVAAGTGGTIILSEERKKIMIEHILNTDDTEDKIYPSIWTKVFKKELLEKAYGGVEPSAFLGEDLVNLLYCIYEAGSVCLLREAYYHYRYREMSMAHYVDIDKLFKVGDLFRCIRGILKSHGDEPEIKKVVNEKYVNALLDCLDSLTTQGDRIYRYYFQDIDKIIWKKVVLYGAGTVGKSYYNQFMHNYDVTLTAWVDKNYRKLNAQYCSVRNPEIIRVMDFDIIVIALLDWEKAHIVMDSLIKMGVPFEKIIWSKPRLRFLCEEKVNKSI